MGLIDSHTHLDSFHRKGLLDATLQRAWDNGIEAVITIGTADDDWAIYRSLASQYPRQVYYSAGLHPCSVDETWEQQTAQLPDFWETREGRPVALGECGLDRFHLPKNSDAASELFDRQKAAFRMQLGLAKQLDCPVVVHSRGAFNECVEEIDASGVSWDRVVFHCFAEGPAEMTVLRERGGVGSFTGILTYKSARNVREAAQVQGLDHFMVETDAPYLTPVPHRGKPNEPAFVRHTAEFAADLFGVSFADLARRSSRNAKRFYQLPG